jgi:hypothetical protein
MSDPHSGFIIAAYAVAAGTIAATIGWVAVDFRRLSAQLDLATRALESARAAQMAPSANELQVEAGASTSRYGTHQH